MIKKSLLIWVIILTFGIASMPVLGFSANSKQTGNTETSSKKPKKKHSKTSKKHKKGSKKTSKKHKGSKKHKKGSSKYKSGGKKKVKGKKHSKNVKYKKGKKHSKGRKHGKYSKGKRHGKKHGSRRHRTTYVRKHYTPPTNSNNVEYRNYKRSDENNNSKENIEKIAPQKEIRKEPKKEGEN